MKTDFEQIQKAVFVAAGFLDCTTESDPLHFALPVGASPKPVRIVLTDGRVVSVNHEVALQRILAGIAALLP